VPCASPRRQQLHGNRRVRGGALVGHERIELV
jgi:hypothetical protein